jgi:transcriptional regulator with XRE-family HTH domain
MKQPQVARLELGEVNPSMDTLMRISSRLGIEFTIDIRRAGEPAHNVNGAGTGHAVGALEADGAEPVVAAR